MPIFDVLSTLEDHHRVLSRIYEQESPCSVVSVRLFFPPCPPRPAPVGRRQFVSFDSAQAASGVLGCEGEELQTAVFKHHLRQLLQRATGGGRERGATAESEEGEGRTKAREPCGESNSQQKFNVVVCPHSRFYVLSLPSSSCHVMLTIHGSMSSSSSSAFEE